MPHSPATELNTMEIFMISKTISIWWQFLLFWVEEWKSNINVTFLVLILFSAFVDGIYWWIWTIEKVKRWGNKRINTFDWFSMKEMRLGIRIFSNRSDFEFFYSSCWFRRLQATIYSFMSSQGVVEGFNWS